VLSGIRQAREDAKLTQAELARRAKISVATLRRAETDESSVSDTTLAAIRKALGVASKAAALTGWERIAAELSAHYSGEPITPRQAHALAIELGLNGEPETHLTEVISREVIITDSLLFGLLPPAILMRVGENAAWLARFTETCSALADEIYAGKAGEARNWAEAFAYHLALHPSSGLRDKFGDLTDSYDETDFQQGSEDPTEEWDEDEAWENVDEYLIPPAASQAIMYLGVEGAAEAMLAPIVTDGRLDLPLIHPFRWWEPWDLIEADHAASLDFVKSLREMPLVRGCIAAEP
jgi:transcriptional regulator with XRE-family HTH domain